ncbi:MAG: hypothetical protein QM757_34070 [Paludibaculum sp.]
MTERAQDLLRLFVRRFSDGQEHLVYMPEPDYTLKGGGGFEYDTPGTTSSTTPPGDATLGVRLRHEPCVSALWSNNRLCWAASNPKTTSANR